jgi:hypothetical protein
MKAWKMEVLLHAFLTSEHYKAHHEDMENGGIAPCILNLGTRWTIVTSFTPQPLYPEDRYQFPLNKRLGEIPQPVWTSWRREKSQTCQNCNYCHSVNADPSLVNISTKSSRLQAAKPDRCTYFRIPKYAKWNSPRPLLPLLASSCTRSPCSVWSRLSNNERVKK